MPEYQRVRARSLAQWAVNVVDFRDSDATMTRFEYDETPFQTRPGRERLGTKDRYGRLGNGVSGTPYDRDLVFHDKRVKDTMNVRHSKRPPPCRLPSPTTISISIESLKVRPSSSSTTPQSRWTGEFGYW